MKISWEWLKKLVDLKGIKIESIAERLTLAGFEVEHIVELINGHKLLEITSTTNRSDTLSMIGIAKEISAITNKELKIQAHQSSIYVYNQVSEANQESSNRFLQTHIVDLQVSLTPMWIQSILKDYGIHIENTIVDILHFIELKWSKFFNIQDLQNIKANINNEPNSLYLYCDKAISTLHSKPDHLNPSDLLTAYSECLILITKIYRGVIKETQYFALPSRVYEPVMLRSKVLQEILGPFSSYKQILLTDNKIIIESFSILCQLGFIVKKYHTYLVVMVPLNRQDDIYREIDLIEEVSRVYGFDQFLDQLPIYRFKGSRTDTKYRLGHIKSVLRSNGYHESIHSPFENQLTSTVAIYNPLIEEFSNLKSNLINKLLKVNLYNLKQGNGALNLFEVGRVFIQNSRNHELMHIAGIFGGDVENRRSWTETQLPLDWFQAKGQIETFFERLNLSIGWLKYDNSLIFDNNINSLFHVSECAVLTLGSKSVGIFGSLKDDVYNKKGMNIQLYGFEILVDCLLGPLCASKLFVSYSKFPSIIRDITMTFDINITVQKIMDIIHNDDNEVIESVKLINLYEVQKDGIQTRNLSFRITYRSSCATLTNQMIDQLESQLKKKLTTVCNINL